MLAFTSRTTQLMHARSRAAWLAIRPHTYTQKIQHHHHVRTICTCVCTCYHRGNHIRGSQHTRHFTSEPHMDTSTISTDTDTSTSTSTSHMTPDMIIATLKNSRDYRDQILAEEQHLSQTTTQASSSTSISDSYDQRTTELNAMVAKHTQFQMDRIIPQYEDMWKEDNTWEDDTIPPLSADTDESIPPSPSFLSDPSSTDTLYYHQLIDHISHEIHTHLLRNHEHHLVYITLVDIQHLTTTYINNQLYLYQEDLWNMKPTSYITNITQKCHQFVDKLVYDEQMNVLKQETYAQRDVMGIEPTQHGTQEEITEHVTETSTDTAIDAATEAAISTSTASASTSTSESSSASSASASTPTISTSTSTSTTSTKRPPRVLTPAQLAASAANTAQQKLLSAQRKQKEKLFREQLNLETRVLQQSVDRYKELSSNLVELNKGGTMKPAQRVLLLWYNSLYEAIVTEQMMCKSSKHMTTERQIYAQQMIKLPAAELTVVVIHEMLSMALANPAGVAFTKAALTVGRAVNNEVTLAHLRDDKHMMRNILKTCQVSEMTLPVIYRFASKLEGSKWGVTVHVKLGAVLISMLTKAALVPDLGKHHPPVQAFKHEVVEIFYPKLRYVGMIFCDQRIVTGVLQSPSLLEHLTPKFMPMVIPPRNWTAYDEGGYYSIRCRIMRTHGSHKQIEAVQHANLQRLYDGLNYLGSIPWKINTKIYDVIQTLWTNGGGVAGIPSRHVIPEPPEPIVATTTTTDRTSQRQYKQTLNKIRQSNAELHSQRCDFTYKLQVAEEFAGRTIYYPCNMDFRGRVYPISPHLNHIGSDLCRGLLMFSEPKPLGEHGLYWFKIHCASLYGKNKLPFNERIIWTESNIDIIMKCADDPINQNWWLQADDPFQFLAICFELTNALRTSDPTKYESSLPVHQDGSCNGLQHYAAMGRDEWGGSCVNLTPSDRPQDVYMSVCDQVNVRLAEDANKGEAMAILLQHKVSRKVVKQTVMTSVYGVTFIGARDQILNRLEELTDIAWPEPKEQSISACAAYLSKITLSSLSDLFNSARAIMDWLKTCAGIMATYHQPVAWITPLGLPVVQPYRRATSYQINTLMQKVCIADHSDLLPVSGSKQMAAFPPNFVHSLDATHMLLTALDCKQRGITFSAVHDSYWTHACDMSRMNESLRSQFVSMYSEPILEELRASFVARFPGVSFPPVPKRGTLDIQLVKKSTYFFN